MVVLVLLALAQVKPGPLDTFRANYASIRASASFVYKSGLSDRSVISDGRIWSANGSLLAGDRVRLAVSGRWEFDGRAEHFVIGAPDGPKAQAEGPNPANPDRPRTVTEAPAFELLTDNETSIHRQLGGGLIEAESGPFRAGLPRLGPFGWWGHTPFPLIVSVDFPNATVSRRTAIRAGHPTEVEVYRRDFPGGWLRLEVSYDPAIGHLPRYARGISLSPIDKKASVKEMYLIHARPCPAGGFVPTEWYETAFMIDDFTSRYPRYSEDMVIFPKQGDVVLGHFVVNELRGLSTPVRFELPERTREIAAPGGLVPVKHSPRTLTLGELKSLLGKKLTERAQPVLPHLDEAELREFDEPRSTWSLFFLGMLVPIVVLGAFLGWRRLRARWATP